MYVARGHAERRVTVQRDVPTWGGVGAHSFTRMHAMVLLIVHYNISRERHPCVQPWLRPPQVGTLPPILAQECLLLLQVPSESSAARVNVAPGVAAWEPRQHSAIRTHTASTTTRTPCHTHNTRTRTTHDTHNNKCAHAPPLEARAQRGAAAAHSLGEQPCRKRAPITTSTTTSYSRRRERAPDTCTKNKVRIQAAT